MQQGPADNEPVLLSPAAALIAAGNTVQFLIDGHYQPLQMAALSGKLLRKILPPGLAPLCYRCKHWPQKLIGILSALIPALAVSCTAAANLGGSLIKNMAFLLAVPIQRVQTDGVI